jgi:hypothetical protein
MNAMDSHSRNSYSARGSPKVQGVLLEGGCFSGKSSVAKALEHLLAAHGLQPQLGHCYVCNDEENVRLHAMALSSFADQLPVSFRDPNYFREFNRYRSLNVMHDANLLRHRAWPPQIVQVQDRHWFSQHCQNDYFTPDIDSLPLSWRTDSAPRFDLHVFLSISDGALRSRAQRAQRAGEHGVHRHFRRFATELADFESHCRNLWPSDPAWIMLDMDQLSADAAAATICDAYFARTSRGHVEEARSEQHL